MLRRKVPLEIPVDWTASDLDDEHKLAYFREDVGLNLFHWQWHLVFPTDGPRFIVAKNRRGELFYYLHQQIIARWEGAEMMLYFICSRRVETRTNKLCVPPAYVNRRSGGRGGWGCSRHTRKNSVLYYQKNTEIGTQREYRVSVLIFCGLHKALYKIPQKTGTELPYSLEYEMSGQIVDQKCSVLFLCFFLAVLPEHRTPSPSGGRN